MNERTTSGAAAASATACSTGNESISTNDATKSENGTHQSGAEMEEVSSTAMKGDHHHRPVGTGTSDTSRVAAESHAHPGQEAPPPPPPPPATTTASSAPLSAAAAAASSAAVSVGAPAAVASPAGASGQRNSRTATKANGERNGTTTAATPNGASDTSAYGTSSSSDPANQLLTEENEQLRRKVERMERELRNLKQQQERSMKSDDANATSNTSATPNNNKGGGGAKGGSAMGQKIGSALIKLAPSRANKAKYEPLSAESPEQEMKVLHQRHRALHLQQQTEADHAYDAYDVEAGGAGGGVGGSAKTIPPSAGSKGGRNKAKLSDEEMDDDHHHNHNHDGENDSFVEHDLALAERPPPDAVIGNGVDGGTPFRDVVKDRAGWLVGLLVLQSCSSFILARNEALLESHLVIVQFLTMLVGAGGNAGNQASVRVIRGLAVGTLNDRTLKPFLWTEAKMGVALSAILGLAGFVRASVFMVPVAETIAITTSLYMIVISSVCIGALLPLAMHRCGLDPAHSSTTIQVLMDILGVTMTVWVSGLVLNTSFGLALTAFFHGGGASALDVDDAVTDDVDTGGTSSMDSGDAFDDVLNGVE